MDSLISSASALQQAQTQMAVQTSVMKKTLDVQKSVGETIVGLIDSASSGAKTSLHTNGRAVDCGENVDVCG